MFKITADAMAKVSTAYHVHEHACITAVMFIKGAVTCKQEVVYSCTDMGTFDN